MKHGKKPTVRQSKIMRNAKLKPEDWFVTKDTSEILQVVSKATDKVVDIPKDLYGE